MIRMTMIMNAHKYGGQKMVKRIVPNTDRFVECVIHQAINSQRRDDQTKDE